MLLPRRIVASIVLLHFICFPKSIGWPVSSPFTTTHRRHGSYLMRLHSMQPNWIARRISDNLSPDLILAAANLTQSRSTLLGVKTLGVDYGLARTGVAVSVGYDPRPLAILATDDTLLQTLVDMAAAENVHQIVVGLPLHKNGTLAEQTDHTVAFVDALIRRTLPRLGPNVPIYLWDERYSSKEAASRQLQFGVRNRNNLQGTLDADAAAIILEHYYAKNGDGAQLVTVDDDEELAALLEPWQRLQTARDTERAHNLHARQDRVDRRRQALARDAAAAAANQVPIDSTRRKKKKKKRR